MILSRIKAQSCLSAAAQMRQMAEMMRADPGMAERMRSITASLTPDQIDAMVSFRYYFCLECADNLMDHVVCVQARTQGLAGLHVSPDMAATAASQMANMTPEQLENMAMMADLGQQQQQRQPSAAAPSISRPAAAAGAQAPIMPSAGGASDPMQAASTLMQVCNSISS